MADHTKGCYWFTQGKCQLFHMEDRMVYNILSRVPKAREDLAGCGVKCPNVDVAFIEFAENPDTMVQEQHEVNEAHMKHVQKYVDYHRYAVANATTPNEDDDGGE
jgi:hypothetical protein